MPSSHPSEDGAGSVVDDVNFFSALAHLRSIDPSTLDVIELRSAIRGLRLIRGWVDHLDACLRIRATHFEPGTSDDDNCDDNRIDAEALDRDSGIGSAEGRRRRARSRMISMFPTLGPLIGNGQISTEHLDTLAGTLASLDPAIAARITEHADTIAHEAVLGSAPTLRRVVLRIAQLIATDLGIDRRRHQRRSTRLRHWLDGATGMGRIHGELDPDNYQRFVTLLDAEVNRQMRQRGSLHPDRHRALCLLDLMGDSDNPRDDAHTPDSLSIDVLIDATTLIQGSHPGSICEYADGTPAHIADVVTAACTAQLHPILISNRTLPLSVGRRVRHATAAQRRALRAVYATCAIPGCDTPFPHCQTHHIHPWDDGGCTDLDNLLPLCSRHHHLCHDEGWRLHLEPDRTLTVATPDGTIHTATPDRWIDARIAHLHDHSSSDPP